VYFITTTCYRWIPLFEITNFYDEIYKWFDILNGRGHQVTGYVIMPNHLHALVYVGTDCQEINRTMANAKRFMAYEIISRLKNSGKTALLGRLRDGVTDSDAGKRKLHQVFQHSFDCRPCYGRNFFEQKLNYIHRNPCKGKWRLADPYYEYPHSSARYYVTGVHADYPVYDYRLLSDFRVSRRGP